MSKVILGVTGGISAYKACDVISGLQATGHEVRVMMTESAKRFITEETLSVLSKHRVYTDLNQDLAGEVSHIELAKWGDILLIAPATANTIGKIRYGICDNFLTNVIMAYEGPKIIAPAMNTKMWDKVESFVTQDRDWDYILPIEGKMACGDYGVGKLEHPRNIVGRVVSFTSMKVSAC